MKRVWCVVLPAMVVPCLASLFYFVWFSEAAWSRWVYGGTKVFTLVWPLLATFVLLPGGSHSWTRNPAAWKTAVGPGLLAGALVGGAVFLLMATPLGDVVRGGADAIRGKAESLGFLERYWLFAVFLSVVHSALEEYYWRWFVFGRLRSVLPLGWAHALAAASFAAHHIVVAGQFFGLVWGGILGGLVGVGGWIFSELYQRQGTLAGAWLAHMVIDFSLLTVGWQILNS